MNTPPFFNHERRRKNEGEPHIAIVGGGTAGWMAAATLRRRLGCRITLIESSNAPGVGVGEATIPAMIDWIENMGIDEDDFLRQTSGTYKLAIRFDNWVTPRHRYWHPFGSCGQSVDGIDLIHFWKRGVDEGWWESSTHYTDFNLQRLLSEHHRAPRMIGFPSELENYAYHLDAGRLADFIRSLAISEGVTNRIGDVTGAEIDREGDIQQVYVKNQAPLVADWFLDCSGFSSVLIEKTLNVPWIDCSDMLLCDRAVVVRVPKSSSDVAPYTVSTGLNAGWAWQIPLRDNVGAGYVYSSQHISPSSAREELLRHVGLDSEITTRDISMRIGYRDQSWKGNCISIGLAAGFIEPLESTGIFLVQRALDELVDCLPVDCLPANSLAQPRRDIFNHRMRVAYEEVRDFVLLHYLVSRREDTSFWRHARSVNVPNSLAKTIDCYERCGEVKLPSHAPVFAEANHHFIMAGAGRLPAMEAHFSSLKTNPDQLVFVMNRIRHLHLAKANTLPSHRDLLRTIHSVEHTLLV